MKPSKSSMNAGPQTPFSEHIHASKYRGTNESFREAMTRVASKLSDDAPHFTALREVLMDMRFMPAGRIQAAVGSTRQITPYNCFVSGTIEDSMIDGTASIMETLKQAVTTLRLGGGIGYDFSTLRPRGATIRKLHSRSCGPVKLMNMFNAAADCIASAGNRRGAQMGVMRVDHPDIEEFIRAKHNEDMLTVFNVSVAVTDEFMQAVESDSTFDLRWDGQISDTIKARDLWDTIMRSTWDWAEPGVLFIDRINEMNNLAYCETIAATNPCGEQPLPPYGACLLGSFNLVKYLKLTETGYLFDYDKFGEDIPMVVRGMDNVVDIAKYPLYEQEKEAEGKRRMGLGITGLANTIETIGLSYGSPEFVRLQGDIMRFMANEAYKASALLAKEKGAFPMYTPEYLKSKFLSRLDDETTDLIVEHGIRNSHLISVAPTGTISVTADNVSSGIEPVFAYRQVRTVIEEDGPKEYDVDDYAYSAFGVHGKTSKDVTTQEHLAVLAEAYKYVDSAVSKTCNVPEDTSWEDFGQVYIDAWRAGCKGCTTYQTGGKRGAILKEKKSEETKGYCTVDAVTGQKECE